MAPSEAGTGAPTHSGGLLRVLGTAFGLAIAIGTTIGGGIVRTPGEVAAHVPGTVLYMAVWVLGGLGALMGATMYAELGAAIPRSGGLYTFAHRALGDGVGFFVGALDWVNWCLGWAALTIIVGEYTSELLVGHAGYATPIGMTVLTVLALAGWSGIRTGDWIQQATSLMKALALVALAVAAFVLPHPSATVGAAPSPASVATPHGWALLLALALAMQGVVFTYDTYYAVVYCGEEMREPGTEIPRSMFRGVWLIIAIYLLVNAAFLAVLPVDRMAGDNFVGGTLTAVIFGERGDTVIRLLMVVSVLGAVNAHVIGVPRILHAMARDGLFPALATRVNAGGTPSAALWMSYVVAAALVLAGSFEAILGIESVVIVAIYVITFISFFVLRRREPSLPRPYRAWGYPWVQLIVLVGALGLLAGLVVGDTVHALIVLALLLASWPAARLLRRWIKPVEALRSPPPS